MAQPDDSVPDSPGTERVETWARVIPDTPAVVDGDRRLTYQQWNDQADRLAEALVTRFPAASRAAVRTHQCCEWFVINLALSKAGWEHVAVNWRLTPAEVRGVIADSDPALLFFDDDPAGPLLDVCAPAGVHPVSVRGEHPAATRLADLITQSRPVPRFAAHHGTLVTYSSGTTGRPKGTRKQPPRDADHLKKINEFAAPTLVARRRMRQFALLTLPLHHGVGPKAARGAHATGGTVYLMDRYDPVRALEMIQQHHLTHWKCVPTMLQRMRALPTEVLRRYDVSSIRAISVGSAPTPWPLKEWVLDHFGPVLHEGYGASEIGIVTVMRPDMHRRKPGSCGRLRPHVEVRILGPDGAEVPRGVEGELLIRTPISITGYLNPRATEGDQITPEGFFRTGDIGRLDEDGFLFITGRAKDMIIAGGVNIYPAEIEEALCRHPDVVEAAVIGIPEETFGEQVMAFCELREGSELAAADLIRFVEPELAPFKRPRQIQFVTGFPRSVLGKVLKGVLREPYWAGRETSI